MTSPPLLISSMRLPLASVGQTGAASCAAASQDLAAIGSSHALAEPVDLGAMTLLRLIGTNHSDTPPVSISSGMQASANHNSRIAPAAVVNQLHVIPLHDYAMIIIAEKKWPCQPKISAEKWGKSVIFSFHPRYSGVICFQIHLFEKFFLEWYTKTWGREDVAEKKTPHPPTSWAPSPQGKGFSLRQRQDFFLGKSCHRR